MLYVAQEEIETLTRRRADSEAQCERRENELRAERDELAKRYLASRDRLDSDRNAYRKKLEAMTGTCKTVTDVSPVQRTGLSRAGHILSM